MAAPTASRDNNLGGNVENIRSLSALAHPYTEHQRNSRLAPVMASHAQAKINNNASHASI